ncbi:hypothetical protein ACU4HD_44190 [Cupriavidus basilensis]
MARLGGDEFGILAEGLALPESAATIGDNGCRFCLRESVEVDVSASSRDLPKQLA